MKTKIVLWGENEKEEKILLGIELLESDNLIRIHMIPEASATEIFYNQMMNQWREGQNIPMPEDLTVVDRPLSMTEGLLPDNLKTQRQDILARAKTEWHFVILSSKLYEAYADEISQIKERISELKEFDGGIWEEMKAFWHKVQDQVQEKNLFREHAAELRTKTNELFDTLKSLKRAMNDEFERTSKEHVDKFFNILQDIEERIEKGLGLQPIFNELKQIQQKFKDTQFTRKHHNDVWKKLDAAFKKVKEKKFGKSQSGGNTASSRLARRFEGLISAIDKMEQSIKRDVKDKQFQERRIGTTDGQLEMQIRQAKMAMIEERIASKQKKLDDMLKTRVDLENKIEEEKARSARKEEKRQIDKDIKEAKDSIKVDIAKDIELKAEVLKEDDDKLNKAAQAIKEAKNKKKIPVKNADQDGNVSGELKEEVQQVVEPTDKAQEEKVAAISEESAIKENIPEEVSTDATSDDTPAENIAEAKADIEKQKTTIDAPFSEIEDTKTPEATSEIKEEIKAIAEEEE